MPQPIADTGGGGSDWKADVESMTEAIQKAARKALREEAELRHRGDSERYPAPTNSTMAKTYAAYEDWIDQVMAPMKEIPDPSESTQAGEKLSRVAGSLPAKENPGKGDHKKAKKLHLDIGKGALYGAELSESAENTDLVHDWMGHAADKCRKFLELIPPATKNQIELAKLLRDAINLNGDTMRTARKNLKRISDSTVTALETLHSGGGVHINITMDTSMAAAVTTVAAGLATEGWAGVLTVLAGVYAADGGISVSGQEPGNHHSPMKGDDVDGVLESFHTAVNRLLEAIDQDSLKLGRIMEKNLDVLHRKGSRKCFCAPRPKPLVDSKHFEADFRHMKPDAV